MLIRTNIAAAAMLFASQLALAGPIDRTEIADAFWRDVWQARNPAAVDHYVVDDFVITTGGKDINSRENFKTWLTDFQSRVGDLKLEVLETFPSADGTRTVSRLRVSGGNKGMMGLPPDGRPFTLTATSILAFNSDGKILHNWVERNAWEVYNALTKAP
jgi:predicted ester cyclase